MVSTPDVPDPAETAAAQSAANKETAIAQYELGATNQVTPFGSLSYEQTGTSESGTPTYTATQTFSPDQQKIADIGERMAIGMGRTAQQQLGAVQETLAQPIDLSPSETEAYLFELGSSTLEPYFTEEQAQLDTQLRTEGIMPGSDAYVDAMNEFTNTQDEAYVDLMLSGHETAVNDMMLERTQPLNELNALMTGSQVTSPTYAATPQPTVQPTDVAGITQAAYEAEMASYNAMMGGLMGIPTSLAYGWATGIA